MITNDIYLAISRLDNKDMSIIKNRDLKDKYLSSMQSSLGIFKWNQPSINSFSWICETPSGSKFGYAWVGNKAKFKTVCLVPKTESL